MARYPVLLVLSRRGDYEQDWILMGEPLMLGRNGANKSLNLIAYANTAHV